jgi:hypothetical protein
VTSLTLPRDSYLAIALWYLAIVRSMSRHRWVSTPEVVLGLEPIGCLCGRGQGGGVSIAGWVHRRHLTDTPAGPTNPDS